jgi:hypothetical protein
MHVNNTNSKHVVLHTSSLLIRKVHPVEIVYDKNKPSSGAMMSIPLQRTREQLSSPFLFVFISRISVSFKLEDTVINQS